MSLIKKRKKWNSHGVSEVVGNLLILAITVTLFSSVLMWVSNMPTPDDNFYGDFTSTLELGDTDVLTIVHESGPTLKDYRTYIHVIVNDDPSTYGVGDSEPPIGESWEIGETWTKDLSALNITADDPVQVMIVDQESNSLVWSDDLRGLGGEHPPLITDRYLMVETNEEWSRSASVIQGQSFKVMAQVSDVDADLDYIYANLTDMDVQTGLAGMALMTDVDGDGVWSTAEYVVPKTDNVGSNSVPVRAFDQGNRSTLSTLVVDVVNYTTGPPSIMYTSVEPSSSLIGTVYTVRCYITDPNGDLDEDSVYIGSNEGADTFGPVETVSPTASSVNGLNATEAASLRFADEDYLNLTNGDGFSLTSWGYPTGFDTSSLELRTAVIKMRYATNGTYENLNGDNLVINGNNVMPIQNWSDPIVRVYDLGTIGIDTFAEVEAMDVSLSNTGNGSMLIDYVRVEVTYTNSTSTLSDICQMEEDPYSPGHFTATGVANYEINDVLSRVYYYTISAKDDTGNEVSVTVSHNVMTTDTVTGGGGGDSGTGPGGLMYSSMQGFNTYEHDDWDTNRFDAEARTSFEQGDLIDVVVASKYLVNLQVENDLKVMDPVTKARVPMVSSPSVRFSPVGYTSGYYIYNATIDSSYLDDGEVYMLQISLRDNWSPNNMFFATQAISIGSSSTSVSMTTFSDAAYTTECSHFHSNDVIYVQVETDLGGDWDPWGGDVEIRDFFSNTQVKKLPPSADSVVSDVTRVGTSNVYRLSIDLDRANQDPWIPGNNSYLLRYDMFKTEFEAYLFSNAITVTAPQTTLDLVAAFNEATRYDQANCIMYYDSDDRWDTPEVVDSTDVDTSSVGAEVVRIADIDNDGRTDIVGAVLITDFQGWLFNHDRMAWQVKVYYNDGSWTQEVIQEQVLDKSFGNIYHEDRPVDIQLTNIDYDNDLDIVIAYNEYECQYYKLLWIEHYEEEFEGSYIQVYRNDGSWSESTLCSSPSEGVTCLMSGDLDGPSAGNDPDRSQDIVAGTDSGRLMIFKNMNGVGTDWDSRVLEAHQAPAYYYAVSENLIAGTPLDGTNHTDTVGDYLNYRYEYLQEGMTYQLVNNTVPVHKNHRDTTGEASQPSQLYPDDGNVVYTVNEGRLMLLDQWDPSDLDADRTIENVTLQVRYRTTNYGTDPGDVIWWSTGTYDDWDDPWTDISWSSTGITVQSTAGSFVTAEAILELGSITTTQLKELKIALYNSHAGSSINLDHVVMDVQLENGYRLNNTWRIDIAKLGNPNELFIRASEGPSTEGFTLGWSTIENGTYTPFDTITIDQYSTTLYSQEISGLTGDVVYVRILDQQREYTDETVDWIKVYQLYVRSMITVTDIGSSITDIDIGDIDGVNGNDIICSTQVGTGSDYRVWVGFNDGSGNALDMEQVSGSLGDRILRVQAGQMVGGSDGVVDSDMDIAFATSTKLFMLRQDGPTSFSQSFASFSAIQDIFAGDVNGDGDDDIILASGSQLIMYRSYGTALVDWETELIDDPGGTINCIYAAEVSL